MRSLSTQVITTDEGFQALEREWDELHARARGTVFQSFRWLSSWWQIYRRPNLRLVIAAVRDQGELIGILPAFIEVTGFGVTSLQRMRFLGTFEVYGEYGPLIDPERVWEVTQVLARFCAEELESGRCDLLTFFRFPSTSVSMGILLQELGTGPYHLQHEPDAIARVSMRLPGEWESYLKSLSPAEQDILKRRSRSLEKSGVELEVITEPSDSDFSDFVRLHTAAWTDRGISGYFGSERFEKFQRTATREFMQRKQARLYFFKKEGVRFAAVHAFFMHDTCCFYLSGLDRTHELVRYSPGKVLLSFVIRDAIQEKCEIFDFQGGVEEYKFRLGGKQTSFAKTVVWKKGLPSMKVVPILLLLAIINLLVGGLWAYHILPRARKFGALFLRRSGTAPLPAAPQNPPGPTTEKSRTNQALEPVSNDAVRQSGRRGARSRRRMSMAQTIFSGISATRFTTNCKAPPSRRHNRQ